MNPISFNTFSRNTKNANNIITPPSSKIAELKNDAVELSTKKTDEKPKKGLSKKQLILIGAAAGLAIGACIAIVKARNLSKAKQEISALYDNLYEEMNKNTPEQLNFEKPELIFKRLKDGLGGGYDPSTNQINIDPRDLRHTCLLKDLKTATTTNIAENLDIADTHGRDSVWNIIRKGVSDKFRIATKNEALAVTGSTLTHELQHAKQFQILLSTEGGLEKYIQSIKEQTPGIDDNTIKNIYPFIFNYKPKMLFNPDKVIIQDDVAGKCKIKYGVKDLIEAFTKYTTPDENKLKYYTNLAEIGARAKEATYWQKLANGELPRPEGVSDELIEHFRKINTHNAIKLAKVVANNG